MGVENIGVVSKQIKVKFKYMSLTYRRKSKGPSTEPWGPHM